MLGITLAASSGEAMARYIDDTAQSKAALIVVDGDDTYYAEDAHKLLEPILKGEADMVVGNRLKNYTTKSFRPLHTLGNKIVKNLVNNFFRANLKDIMSGLRVMNRTFVKNINITGINN